VACSRNVAAVILQKYIFKKTGSKKSFRSLIKLKRLSESVFLGRKKYFIVLQNGKQRDLLAVKSDAEFVQVRKLLRKTEL
jgi:hypothetical protein